MPARLGIVLFMLLAFLCPAGFGAEATPSSWFYRAWQTEDGLPDNGVSGVAQSADGYLWVATKGGLMRFNGAEFKAMPLRQFPELPSRAVRAMLLDSQGRIWISMERGPLVRIGVDSIRAYTPADGLFPQRVSSLAEDGQGHIWAGYAAGICRIDEDEVIVLDRESGTITIGGGLPKLACDPQGRIWMGSGDKLGVLDEQGLEQRHLFDGKTITAVAGGSGIWVAAANNLVRIESDQPPETLTILPEGSVISVLYEDRDGAVWIGTKSQGLFHFHQGVLEKIPTSHLGIACITEDHEGNLWVGTQGGGLNLIKPRAAELIRDEHGSILPSAQSVSAGTDGRVWAVTQKGALVSYLNGELVLESAHEIWSNKQASCVSSDSRGGTWVGTRNHGVLVHQQGKWTRIPLRPDRRERVTRSIMTATNGDVWVATDAPFQLHRIRDKQITTMEADGQIEFIRALAEGIDGTIWAASSDGRLLKVADDKLIDEETAEQSLSVRTLHVSSDGSLWIGYAGEGLGHLKDGRYNRITKEEHGLYDNYISQILEDDRGFMWITANRGLFQVETSDLIAASEGSTKRLRPRLFGRTDGLPSLQPSRNFSPSASRSREGHLWFAMSRGLLMVQPDKIKENPTPPPVVLEEVSIDNQPVALYRARSTDPDGSGLVQTDLSLADQVLRVPPGPERLVIKFAALSLTSPENVHFRYRLKPFESHWEETVSGRNAAYPRLPAGKYEFQVVASNNLGVWNETGASLEIIVEPFFWETWWFKIGGGIFTALAAGGIVFLWLRWRHKRQLGVIAEKRALEQERSRIARDIHDDLGASLTRITLLSQSQLSAQEEPAEIILEQIHTTARHLMRSMEEVVWAVNPEHDTFDALANYLSNYGQGFLGLAGIRCRLDMPMILPERPLSAQVRHNLFLAFKEALNNTVKYSEASEARISLEPSETRFLLRIADNGRGFDPSSPSEPGRSLPGNGLTNMKSRMEEIGGSFALRSVENEGTTVEFEVPFKPPMR